MNIVRNDVDACNATLTLTIEKQDYAEKVDKSLKEYRRKVQMPGFRPGNVPAGLVKKMYGKSILAEEVNKLISESLYNYIRDNKINILGEPLSNETIQKPIDFDTDETFEFVFDLGLSPEISIDTTAKDKIPYYKIAVTDEMIDEHIKMHASRLGQYVAAEKTEENSVIKGEMTEITTGSEPLKVVDAIITPRYIKDDKQKKLFVGKKVGAKIKFNPVVAMTNEYEVSSLLNVSKDKVKDYDHDFEYIITEITNHQSAEIDQVLFDKVVGEGVVKNLEEFKEKMKEGIARVYVGDSDYKFSIDAKELFVKKNKKAVFPEEFLKRWLKATNEKMTDETIEKDFPNMLEYLKWDLIKKMFVEKYEIKIEDQEIKDAARQDVLMRFAQYGINNPQDDILDTYVEESLKQKGAFEQFYQQAVERAVIAKIKENVAITEKEITLEEFNKLFSETK
ncbi:peptidylprolyl isomerase [Porphyromonadaceae bacterium COT-184 OH4590]|nr:peptidylprolyl isomerase [Porphyromonadaceae bacterium COT-184 OH4590]MDO4725996.1 trigger factor [Porphyromonadaceae bacterium]